MLASRHKERQDDHKHALMQKTIKDNTPMELKYQVGQAQMVMII